MANWGCEPGVVGLEVWLAGLGVEKGFAVEKVLFDDFRNEIGLPVSFVCCCRVAISGERLDAQSNCNLRVHNMLIVFQRCV